MARNLGYARRAACTRVVVQVIWSPLALRDLAAIRDYIGTDSPLAAQRMAQRLRHAGEALADLPTRGRPASGGLRELAVVYPYVIRYEALGELVRIVRIKHGAQRPG